jgi:hypothetical protein
MNWDAVGAVAELLGALGVIASLVYLGRQISHNSRIVQASTNQAVADSAQARLLTLASSPSLAESLAKLRAGDAPKLTPAEALQTSYFRHAMFRGFENTFIQHRSGLLSDPAWLGYSRIIRGQFEREPDLEAWWSVSR